MKTVKTEGQSRLVEFEEGGELKRRVLPLEAADVALGAPYGLPFALLLQREGLPRKVAGRIERELHRRNIWTAEDLQENPRAALAAIQAAYGLDVQTLLRLARRR